MCFSAPVSYSAAAILVGTGLYALRQSRQLPVPYWLWAATPLFFGIQQAFEGRVWQMLEAGDVGTTVSCAMGFHFFSHWLWLWWFPLCCYLVEPSTLRQRIIAACAMFGAFVGTLVYGVIVTHPEWMSVVVRENSIYYGFTVPYQSSIHLPITPAVLYGLIVMLPLLISSHNKIKIFGLLMIASVEFADVAYNYAYVSVWCFFAAIISLYIVYMIRQFALHHVKITPANPSEAENRG
jgi:hypothetical protein